MTTTTVDIDGTAKVSGPWRTMSRWASAHAVDDFYQGLVPASIPYFVLERHYDYLAASALTLAATLGGSLPQPVFGLLADRRPLLWMAPAGVAVAGVGAGLSGLVGPFPLVWLLLLVSGLGVAMFHPAAGRDARRTAGNSTQAMSLFAAGGSVGFFLAPALATPLLVHFGVGATAFFIPPAVLMGAVLLRGQRRPATVGHGRHAHAGTDRWGPFLVLTGTEIARSVTFFGINTFLALYWIGHLHAGRGMAGAALTAFLVGGVAGTLLGGRLGDRFGSVRVVQVGSLAATPALILLRLCPNATLGLACAVVTGIAANIPFSVLVKLGQDYLPTRPGTASGVTLGLAVSIGGLFTPLFGALADRHGTATVFTVLCAVPLVAFGLSLLLPQPTSPQPVE